MTAQRVIVVGLASGRQDAVLREAVVFAQHFSARLVCATVDSSRYAVQERPDGTVLSQAFDPDVLDSHVDTPDPAIRAWVAEVVDPTGVKWEMRALAGDPARALAHLADSVDAAMIVVGTHERRVGASMRSFFAGSVGAHLTHRQHRPVLIIPLDPVGPDQPLPWEPD